MAALSVILALLLMVSPAFAVTSTLTCASSVGTNWTVSSGNGILDNDGTTYTQFNTTTRDILSVTNCTPSPAIPDGSTITGIQVHLNSCGTGGTAGSRQFDIALLNITCTGKTGQNQPQCTPFVDTNYPAVATDTWSCTGSPWNAGVVSTANINNSAFGFTLRDNNSTANALQYQYGEIILTFTTTSTTTTTLVGGNPPQRRLM